DCQVAGAQFSLTAGLNVITDVHWWGSYYPSPFTDNFTINIYNFVAGNPSTIPIVPVQPEMEAERFPLV
ncbi:MAG: hypothetical protein WCA19_16145, partial [Candidatus Acidiferrales bacterium]